MAEYEVPFNQTSGLAWDPDNGWMWGISYGPRRLYVINPDDGEVMVNVAVGGSYDGLYYHAGIIHAGGYYARPNNILRYDNEGNELEPLDSPIRLGGDDAYCYDLETDGEFLFILSGVRNNISVFNLDNFEEVGTIDFTEAIGNVAIFGIAWVAAHPDGQLWLSDAGSHLYQVFVDGDWNAAHADVFTGVSYDVTVEVTNTGSAPLEVFDIYCDNNRFTADQADLVLEHDESAEVTFTFQTEADDPGDFAEMMIFESNDPDNQEYEVALHAEAMRPPEVRIEPGAIEDDLFVGRVEEYTITVFNDGEAPLKFTVTHEIISEPEQDADNRYRGARQLRNANQSRNGNTSLFR